MGGKQHVLVFLPFLTKGGAETQGLLLAQGLQRKGYQVQVCGFDLPVEKCNLIPELERANMPFFRLPFSMEKMRSRKAIPGLLWQFTKLLRARQIDVVIPFTWYPNLLSGVCSRAAGIKTCFWNQRNVEDHVPATFLENLLPVSRLVFVSNSTPGKKFEQRRFNLPPSRISVIRNGLQVKPAENTEEYWRSVLGISDNRVVITMVANFFIEKDFITVIKAMAIVAKQKADVLLVFAGGGGNEAAANQAKALVLDLGLTGFVRFAGSVHDVQGLLSVTHIGLLSSKSEGTSNSIMEYMSAGLPVIATRIEGIVDMLGENYPYLFNVADTSALASLILALAGNKDKCHETGLQLKEQVQRNYSFETMVSGFEELIKENE